MCLFLAGPAYAGETSPGADVEQVKYLLLQTVKQTALVQQQLADLKKEPPTKKNQQDRDDLLSQLDQLAQNFEANATQLSTEEMIPADETKTDWTKQVQELAAPLLESIGDLTRKPRLIDKLKKRIAAIKGQLEKYEQAHKNIEALLADAQRGPRNGDTDKYIARLRELEKKYHPQFIQVKLEESRRTLANELSDKSSFVDLATQSIRGFFKHRGLNLLIAAAAVLSLWWGLMRLRRVMLTTRGILRLAPWLGKLLHVAYHAFALVLCLVVSLLALYLLNDWLLLSIGIIFVVAIAWTSRQLIPKFYLEVQLALGLGTVRENERFVWNGVPWLVRSIGMQATLTNERLEDGRIQLRVQELVGKHSRPTVPDEPWFPTQVDDWVILADTTYGKVEHQTQEQVILELKGGARKFFPTAEFLKLTPTNLSSGYRHYIEIGLDYKLLPGICGDIPRQIESDLRHHLQHRLQPETPDFPGLTVELDRAGPSALMLKTIVDVDGRCAGLYEETRREVQRTLARICGERGFEIPFNRMTVTLAEPLLPKNAGPLRHV